jgi:hypothetical protein
LFSLTVSSDFLDPIFSHSFFSDLTPESLLLLLSAYRRLEVKNGGSTEKRRRWIGAVIAVADAAFDG